MVGIRAVTSRGLAGLCAALLTLPAIGLLHHDVAADGTGPAFHNTGLSGGGFISVLARSPTGTLIAGGDTQGLFRSVDGGQTWTPEDAGLPSSAYNVAALLSVAGTWFAAVGDGGSGGIATSVDDGVTWREFAHASAPAPPDFDGSNLPGQSGHPRATGTLLAAAGSYLYAAAFGRGLQRWALNSPSPGTGWQCVALCTSYLNALTLDGKGDAFISVISRTGASKGVYEVTGIATHAATKALSAKNGVSTGVQELLSLGSRVYSAGANGIGYWTGGKWFTLDTSSHWYTLSGYETASGTTPVDVLYAATYSGHGANDVERLMVTGNSVAITGLVPIGSAGSTIYGTTTTWWESTSAGTGEQNLGPEAMIGGCPSSTSPLCSGNSVDFYVGSSILLLTQNGSAPDVLLVGGRSGIWHADPSTTPAWLPAVSGIDSTFDLDVAVDPENSANVAASDVDWSVLASTDDMADIDGAMAPPLFAPSSGTGYAVAWDTSITPSALIASGGNRNKNAQGSIWYDATWATGGPWVSLPLPAGVSTRPLALASEATSTPGVYRLLAAFQKTGVYAFTGTGTAGTWTLVPSALSGGPSVSPSDPHGVSLEWAIDGSAVFMYDAGTHAVWESTFDGTAFAPWAELYADTGPAPGRGWVAVDPNTPTVVWLSNGHGLGAIDTATCTSLCAPTWVTTGTGGPLATYANPTIGDFVYMAADGATPAFTEVQVTNCAVSCPIVTAYVDAYFDEVAGTAISLAAGSDGSVYLATQGNGIAVATAP
jgi:hypothetical protein